ncbi:hypothetical protein H3221_011960 [Pseudomonas sp. LMG 31766]|uniref:Uncharacterized protein n=1 Tax=Pseudomonas chaetocerotis TaxID=2758695 RepID=A0A931CZM6_9PSED|nr:hypothetical protein [Pseudomonas chaetocerotis]MBZ9665464.1 hypothetical protein [Pseudomonas chaetocerotis]
MPRKPATTIELAEDDLQHGQALLAQQHQVATLSTEHDTQVRAVAAQLGYQLPADCTDPDLIQRDIAANMRRSVEACLEVGRGLQVLKLACPHGEFVERLDALGLDRKVAVKFMTSAAKFASLGSNAALTKALGNQSKLFEMLVLDDEEIQELELTGQTGELHLDDVATMSVKELRAALRETREDKKALAKVNADKTVKIEELSVALAKKPLVVVVPMDEQLAERREELANKATAAEAAIAGALHPAVHLLVEKGEESGLDQRPVIAGMLAQVERALLQIRAEYNIPAEPTASVTPSWLKDEDEQAVKAAIAAAQGQGA